MHSLICTILFVAMVVAPAVVATVNVGGMSE